MRKDGHPTDAPLAGDPETMTATIETLKAAGIDFERPTAHQIKIGDWNFYPARGKMFRDGCPPERDRGIEAFLARLNEDCDRPDKDATKQRPIFRPFVIR